MRSMRRAPSSSTSRASVSRRLGLAAAGLGDEGERALGVQAQLGEDGTKLAGDALTVRVPGIVPEEQVLPVDLVGRSP